LSFPVSEAERRVAEAAVRAFRAAHSRLKEAQTPEKSLQAYRSVKSDFDELARESLESAEADESDDEPDVVVRNGVGWRAAVRSWRTYRCTSGEIRVRRKLYRSERNGPTRCFFEEKRGVMDGGYLPDLGRAVVTAVAEMPAAKARRLLESVTSCSLSSATMKRSTLAVGAQLQAIDEDFFESTVRHLSLPMEAKTLVVSVDGLSLFLRDEQWKLATVATLSFLDADGERLKTIRLAHMPQEGKAAIMAKVKRETDVILARRPDLKVEVVIDGAPDLRWHLQQLFPKALHLTDFFHVMERVAECVAYLCPDEFEARYTRHSMAAMLKRDERGAEHVCNLIEQMCTRRSPSSLAKHIIRKHLAYMRNQQPYMRYAAARRQSMDIGSGPVEAACKTLVTQRMKISGAQWRRPGAGAILHLRSLEQSDRLTLALEHLAARNAA
jgi:hypothetical protein